MALSALTENSKAYRSFIGHLEGSGKTHHTIRSYRSDLKAFETFLTDELGKGRPVALSALKLEDLGRYGDHLKVLGFKTNSRRRKLLTVRKLLRYLRRRKRVHFDVDQKIPAPAKLERVPPALNWERLHDAFWSLPETDALALRNKLLLLTLFETGCRVSELAPLQYADWQDAQVSFQGPERATPVSPELVALARRAQATARTERPFVGFNRHGPVLRGEDRLTISDRGLELIVEAAGESVTAGLPKILGEGQKLTPRLIRHTVVLHWLRSGVGTTEIERRLGLKTAYALRAYAPLVPQAKSSSKATSSV